MTGAMVAWFDRFNALIELAILIPFAFDVRALVRARDSRAISLSAQWQYGAYCAWWAVYFGTLEQWWSLSAAALWVAAYAIKITLVMHFRPDLKSRPAAG